MAMGSDYFAMDQCIAVVDIVLWIRLAVTQINIECYLTIRR